MILGNEYEPLSESAFSRGSDIITIKIISEGWGSSGYYSKNVLSEAAGLYKAGTRMFLNHPTRTEQKERPERSIHDLAGYLTENQATWEDNGPAGPGLYQTARLLPGKADFLRAAGPAIGISHFAEGLHKTGQAEGRTGPIIEAITTVFSCDFVTQAGRGGMIVSESFRGMAGTPSDVDDSTRALYESYRRSGMSDSTVRYVIQRMTGVMIPEGGPRPAPASPGSLAEANEMLIQSYIESGMREDTARKIVSGM